MKKEFLRHQTLVLNEVNSYSIKRPKLGAFSDFNINRLFFKILGETKMKIGKRLT